MLHDFIATDTHLVFFVSPVRASVPRILLQLGHGGCVRDDRANLMVRIREQVNIEGGRFGVRIIDARIRRADLPREISEKVYSRMQTERAREAAEYRAQGSEQAQKINAKADRDVVVLRADAQRQADQVRGQGDAERNRIFAEKSLPPLGTYTEAKTRPPARAVTMRVS